MANTSIWWFIIQSWFDMTDIGQLLGLFSKVSEYIGARTRYQWKVAASAMQAPMPSRVAAPLTRDWHLSGKGWKAPKSKAEKVFHIWINSKKKFKSNLPTILKNTVTQGGSYFVEDELVAHVTIQKLPSLGLEPEVVVWDFQLKYV